MPDASILLVMHHKPSLGGRVRRLSRYDAQAILRRAIRPLNYRIVPVFPLHENHILGSEHDSPDYWPGFALARSRNLPLPIRQLDASAELSRHPGL